MQWMRKVRAEAQAKAKGEAMTRTEDLAAIEKRIDPKGSVTEWIGISISDRRALVEMVKMLCEYFPSFAGYDLDGQALPDQRAAIEALWSEARKKAGL